MSNQIFALTATLLATTVLIISTFDSPELGKDAKLAPAERSQQIRTPPASTDAAKDRYAKVGNKYLEPTVSSTSVATSSPMDAASAGFEGYGASSPLRAKGDSGRVGEEVTPERMGFGASTLPAANRQANVNRGPPLVGGPNGASEIYQFGESTLRPAAINAMNKTSYPSVNARGLSN